MTSSDIAGSSLALAALLDALPDPGILIALPEGRVLAVNELAASFLGRDDLVGIRASDLRDPNDRSAFEAAFEQFLRPGEPPTISLEESLQSDEGPSPFVTTHLRAFGADRQRFVLHVFRPKETSAGLAPSSTLRESVAQLPLPVLIAEPDQRTTVYVNAACADLCGLSSAGLHSLDPARRSWKVCRLDGEEVDVDDIPTMRALERAETFGPEDLVIVPADAPPRVVSVMSAPVRGADGTIVAAVTTMVDVGNVRQIEQELRAAREIAENDARRKGAFYASLSRELRNPLTSILGYLDLIADPDSPERERATWYGQIRKGGEALMTLVQDLVDLGQMEAGSFVLERSGFSTSLALAHVLSQARARAQQRDRDVVSRYTTPVPRTLTWDAARFRQCLSTLLHFVIENTSRGDVTLQAAVIGDGDDRVLAFDVSSTCRDIVQEDLDTLFDPFRPTTRRARPWSLAFPVARRLAQLMGGSIECGLESARLWFRLTIAPTGRDLSRMAHLSLPEHEAPPSTHPPARLRGSVLLVEDSESDRLLVAKMLERSGLRVDYVTCGADALARSVHRYDAILMDVELPDMDGLETTRRLRADGATVPIVALTASVLAGDRERCLDAGCTAYVAKPIDRPMLLRTLDGLISTTEDRRVMSVLPAELASVEPLSSTREDDPSLRNILPQFVTRMGRFVEHIGRAIPEGELASATKTARSLGATAENCGFTPLAEAANALADACERPQRSDEELGQRLDALEQVTKRIQAAYPQISS